MGELGLMPEEFWSLTWGEFHLKFEAFSREQDRQRALIVELASLVGSYDQKAKDKLARHVNQLRRYPLKRWLLPPE